jgi:predicted DNA-binding WGR domain protein
MVRRYEKIGKQGQALAKHSNVAIAQEFELFPVLFPLLKSEKQSEKIITLLFTLFQISRPESGVAR